MTTDEARENYPMILDEDWRVLGYIGLSAKYEGLNDEVHELFQYNVPGRPVPIWQEQSLGQYRAIRDMIGPIFRLATKLLLCPASLDWFYYLIYAPRKLTDPLVQHNGENVYEYRRDDTPMEKRHQMATAALKRLALTHTMCLEDYDDDDADEGKSRPTLKYFSQGVNIRDDSVTTKSGIGPQITISRELVQQIRNMVMEGSQSADRLYTLGTKMAVIMNHEISHGAAMACSLRLLRNYQREVEYRTHAAANNYIRDRKEANINEDLFEDENLAEAGYSWENFVFGGNLEQISLDDPIFFMKWPNFTKGVGELRRGGWKASVTQYIVPKPWIININCQRWWNNVEEGDNTALYIKKIVGVRNPCPVPEVDEDWDASQSSEGTWQTDEERLIGQKGSQRVSRIVKGKTIKDPSAAGANELS